MVRPVCIDFNTRNFVEHFTSVLHIDFYVTWTWVIMIRRERVKQRLALYHGVMPIYMQFSDDVEETFSRAINLLLVLESY